VPYVDQRWLGGMLTNFKTVKTSIKRLKDMKAQQEGGLEAMSKKEQLMFAREMEKLEKDIGGIQDMASLPDAIFVIDVGFHKIAVSEAKKLGIPLVGVVDTNHSPHRHHYVIPVTTTRPKPSRCTHAASPTRSWKGATPPPATSSRPCPRAATNSSKWPKAPARKSGPIPDRGKGLSSPFLHRTLN